VQISEVVKFRDSHSMGMLLEYVAYIAAGSAENSFKSVPDGTVADPKIRGS